MTTALRRCATSVLGLITAVAAGCAVGPNFHRPAAPPDAGYTVQPLTGAASFPGGIEHQKFAMGEDVPFNWWETLGSPEINSLVQSAFRANPTVKAAQAALRQGQQLVYAQQGYFFPSVSADYNFERQKLAGNLTGSNAPGVQGNGTSITAVQLSTPPYNQPLYYNFHTADLTVGFVPDVFGANRRKVESLDAQAQMQRFELEATYISLASNVVAAAIQDASTRAQIQAVKAIISDNEKSFDILSDKHRKGFATGIDLAVQQQQLAQARALLPPLQKQFELNRDLLRALVGNLPNQDVTETVELDALKTPSPLPVSLPSKIIRQRPDIRAAEEQLRSANAQVGVAIAAMLPQFTITGTMGGTATQFTQMFSSGGPFWTLIGDVSQPLFDGGTLWHTKKAADEALRQAAAQYQETVIQGYQNVADTLHAITADADALDAAVASERAAKAVLDLTHRRMQSGYSDALAEFAASMTYHQAILTRLQQQAVQLGDTAALYQALGGGWWNREPAVASAAAKPVVETH
ncbi:MAG TPA: efflux transporter outer membrane subunit [Steroidobacteraceae bacterium]|jgi:NodT family efflux transporter outer membrane factor (OMF) lipoprotein|nr:efflux transporter outer membrane subunit [Steroidobacteraceae bacterium]